jgi:hypothetical protein
MLATLLGEPADDFLRLKPAVPADRCALELLRLLHGQEVEK